MPKSQTGNIDRGVCTREKRHSGRCGNGTCPGCGITLTSENATPSTVSHGSGRCLTCSAWRYHKTRKRKGSNPQTYQIADSPFTFSCGCSGVLPHLGKSNLLAKAMSRTRDEWACRVATILKASRFNGEKQGYKSIDPNTPHSVIRTLMNEENCALCRKPLEWKFGAGLTPHLHHDHASGEIFGFAHVKCNPKAEAKEILRLKSEVKKLQQENQKLQEECEGILLKAA